MRGYERGIIALGDEGIPRRLHVAGLIGSGQITEVSYMFPNPGTTAPVVPKASFVTRVGDLGCGIGYYK